MALIVFSTASNLPTVGTGSLTIQASEPIQEILSTSIKYIEANSAQVKKNLLDCQKETESMSAKCHAYATELAIKLMNDELQEVDFEKGISLIEQATEINKHSFQSTIQWMQAKDLENEQILSQTQEVIAQSYPEERSLVVSGVNQVFDHHKIFSAAILSRQQESEGPLIKQDLEWVQRRQELEKNLQSTSLEKLQ